MIALSDTVLAHWYHWLQWLAIGGIIIALASAVGTVFVGSEIGKRANHKLEVAQHEIESLKPLPLKIRVIDFLNSIDKSILTKARAGEDTFRLSLNFGQAGDLMKLTEEDVNGDYLINVPNSNIIMNKAGMAGEFIIKIGSNL